MVEEDYLTDPDEWSIKGDSSMSSPTELIQKLEEVGLTRIEVKRFGQKTTPVTDWYANLPTEIRDEVEKYVGRVETEAYMFNPIIDVIGKYRICKKEWDRIIEELGKLEIKKPPKTDEEKIIDCIVEAKILSEDEIKKVSDALKFQRGFRCV